MTVVTTSGGFDGFPLSTSSGGEILIAEPAFPLFEIIPSYPYQQYSDDPNIVAFFDACNEIAQTYLDWFNETPLSVYTSASISGQLLDWIGLGIYGTSRPIFSTLMRSFRAGLNAFPLNAVALNGNQLIQSGTAVIADDDYYKRVLTWTTYLGNGRHFNVELLRLKVARFLYGSNGGDATLSQAQAVHITSGYVAAPPGPVLSSVAGGSLVASEYGVQTTYVSPLGETLAGPASSISVSANDLLVVDSPPPEAAAEGYNVYSGLLATNPGKFIAGLDALPLNGMPLNGTNKRGTTNLTLQNTSPIAIGQAWVEPTSGLVTGAPLPAVDTSNSPANLIISVPSGQASQFFKQAFEEGILPYPFQLSAKVLIS